MNNHTAQLFTFGQRSALASIVSVALSLGLLLVDIIHLFSQREALEIPNNNFQATKKS